MVGTCALNDMNAIMKSLGIFILIILLSIVVIYFMYCSQSKHSEILENFTGNEATLTYHNYGSEHTGPYADGDKKTITGDVTLRDCQVYFVGEDQQGDCDEEYKTNPNTTCKYVFKDDWKEIANIKVGENTNYYPNKIYNQNYTKTDINNHHLTAQCVKKFESEIDKRYIYKNNDLINYNHDGSNEGNTLELNYRNNESDKYMKGDFISMTFGIDRIAGDNYTNVIDSICSKKYNPLTGISFGDIFYKFTLDNDDKIVGIQYAKLNENMKSFITTAVDYNDFANSQSTTISFDNNMGIINVSKGLEIVPIDKYIYKFDYNYLCFNEESGIIKSFKSEKFKMNKKYIDNVDVSPITKPLLDSSNSIIVVPTELRSLFGANITSLSSIVDALNDKAAYIIETTNVNPKLEREKLSKLNELYNEKKNEAVAALDNFGIGKTFNEIVNFRFNEIISPSVNDATINNEKETALLIARTTQEKTLLNLKKGYNTYILRDVPFSDKLIETSVTPIIENGDEIYIFKHDGSNSEQTSHTIKFNTPVTADILIVGGGGSGGIKVAGGGGAGGLIFRQNEKLNGTHTITVGKGGDAINVNDTGGLNGYSSSFSNIIALGGGGGGAYQNKGKQAGSGGSGGGSFLPTYVGLDIDVNSLGNDGGVGKYNYGVAGGGMTTTWYWAAGGGGGAGSKGEDAGGGTGNDSNSLSYAGGGGNGLAELNGVDFKTHFNLPTDNSIGHYVSVENKVYFAGGGGGGNDVYNDIARAKIPLGGKGGGGNGINNNITNNSINALANSGGGGGSWGSGSGSSNQVSGKGGSGIVIIRIKDVLTNKSRMGLLPHNEKIARKAFQSQHIDINTKLESFRNYSPALLEPFISDPTTPTTHLSMNERKAGAIGCYIFLEKDEYTDLYTGVTYEGIVLGGIQLVIAEVLSDGYRVIVFNENKAGGNDKKNFTIKESGFYKLRLYFVLYNRWQGTDLNKISFILNCKKKGREKLINLKDYMYKGKIYPDKYDDSIAAKEIKIIQSNNNIIKGLKFEDNDKISVEKFKSYINNDTRDYFNIKYWDTFIEKSTIMLNNKVLLTEECTDTGKQCRLLRNIVRLKNLIIPYINDDNKINGLFENAVFTSPTFKQGINIKDEFTNDVKDITSFITYEKDNYSMNRTQKNITGDLFSFKTRSNTIRSIYVKK